MTDAFEREGGCRCGDVRFRITARPLVTMACHCRGCQRMSGGPYSLSVAVPAAGFAVIGGETVIGGVGEPAMHHHCPRCKSWLFTRPPGLDFMVNVRTPMLDDPAGLEPFVETMTAERFPFAVTGARHGFERFPPDDAWEGLVRAYQAQG